MCLEERNHMRQLHLLAYKSQTSWLRTAEMCSAIVTKTLEQIEDRKQNAIIYNIPESQEEEVEAKITHDKKQVKAVFDHLEVTDSVQPVKCFRLGRKNEEDQRIRSIMVKFKSNKEQEVLLKKALRCWDFVLGGGSKQVAISPDRTKEEREERKNLLCKL